MQKNIFSLIDHEIFIIGSRDGNKVNGQIATWVVKASLAPDPLRIVLLISPYNFTYSLIKQSGFLNIQLLSQKQLELVSLFGLHSGRDLNKFKNIDLSEDLKKIPVINNSCGYITCEVIHELDLGDRKLLVAEAIESVLFSEQTPLTKKFLLENVPVEMQEQFQEKMINDGLRDQPLLRDFKNTRSES